MKYKLTPKVVQQIVENHDKYWDDQRPDLYKYKAAYETKFWNDGNTSDVQNIFVQTSAAYGYIESFISSLFSKNPGVVVKGGLRGRGDATVAQQITNDFLIFQRRAIENAARMALIYPMSFTKIVPAVITKDIYRRMDLIALPPWEVVLDREARRYEDQRFVGHKYFMTKVEADHKFGARQWQLVEKHDYFDDYSQKSEDVDDELAFDYYRYICVVEIYDLHTKQLYFWSPDYKGGQKFVEVGANPFTDPDGDAVCPIVPLYFNNIPDKPLDGYSAMARIYDQIFEGNLIRTYQANGIRKASRQYLVKKGVMDDEQMAQITSGIDGLFVEVDTEESLAASIIPVPHNPVPVEMERYYQQVKEDRDAGSLLAPFTRGEATRASATEIAALASYSSSEIGRMARERDAMLENLARVYLAMLELFIREDGTKELILVENKPHVVKPEDLQEQFLIFAQDQATTPLSESVKKREFIQSIPLLQQLGVPSSTILSEIVRSLGLPESFIIDAEKATKDATQAASNRASSGIIPDPTEQGLGQTTPSGPANLQGVLPGAVSIS